MKWLAEYKLRLLRLLEMALMRAMHYNVIASHINSLNERTFLNYLADKFRRIGTLDQRVVQKLDAVHCEYLISAQPWWISSLHPHQVEQMILAGKINSLTFIHISMPQLDLILQNRHQFHHLTWSLMRGLYTNITTKQWLILWNDSNNLPQIKPFLLEYLSNQRLYELFHSGGQHLLIKILDESSASDFGIENRLAGMISSWNKDEWYEEWSHFQKNDHKIWLQQKMIIHGNIVSINAIDFQRWHFSYILSTFENLSAIRKDKIVELAKIMDPKYLLDLLLQAPINEFLQMIVNQIPVSTSEAPFDRFWNYLYLNINKTMYNANLLHYARQSRDPTKIEIVSLHLPQRIVEDSTIKLS